MACPSLVVRNEETTKVGAGLGRKQRVLVICCDRADASSDVFLATEKPSLTTTIQLIRLNGRGLVLDDPNVEPRGMRLNVGC